MKTVYIGFGTNLGDRKQNIKKALRNLNDALNVSVVRQSDCYETKPIGFKNQPDFINGVVEVVTSLTPTDLLDLLKSIEAEMGRKKTFRNGPRIIDLDILFYSDYVLEDKNLKIPHPDAHTREFVLRGLNQIAPDFIHPVFKKNVAELYRGFSV